MSNSRFTRSFTKKKILDMIPKKMDDKPSQTFFIQQFHEIGWLDPTVKKTDGEEEPVINRSDTQQQLTEINFDKLVYDESKFVMANPPNICFLPSEQLLRKMMKVVVRSKNVDRIMKEFHLNVRNKKKE